ncbi:hypothetical protein [Persephonella sp.]
MDNKNQKRDSIGALWKRTSNSGMEYFAGKIELDGKETQILLFYNNKEKETHPHFKIVKSNNQRNEPKK